MKSTGTLGFGKRVALKSEQGGPPNVLLVQGEAITKLIASPAKPRLNSLPDDFDNKRALYDNMITHDEKGMKANPLPRRSVNRKAKRNAMAN